jgi:hypothetical protein
MYGRTRENHDYLEEMKGIEIRTKLQELRTYLID